MGINTIKIEEFFGAKFEPLDPTLGETQALFCFDGYAHWMVWFDRERQWLHFSADKDRLPCAFPVLEVGVFCSGLRISALTGGGEALILRAAGEHHSQNLFTITKTTEGRLSLCTSVGEVPIEWHQDTSVGWLDDGE